MTELLAANGSFLEGFRYPLLVGFVAMVVTWLVTPLVRKVAISKGAVDDPKQDDRRVHTEPIPRWGGIALFAGIIVSLGVILPFAYKFQPFPPYLIGVMIAGALLVVVGALDDLYQFRALFQFLYLLAVGVAVQFLFSEVGRVQISGMELPPIGAELLAIR